MIQNLIANLYTFFEVSITLRTPLVGGVPTSKALIDGWLRSKNLDVTEEELAKLKEATAAQLPGVIAEKSDAMWTTFKRDDEGIYIEGRQVKAMFKESANICRDLLLKSEGKKEGRSRFTNLKSRLAERLYVVEDKIYFSRAGQRIKEPEQTEERPIHVMTAQGPRTALKKCDAVRSGAVLTFRIKAMNDAVVDLELITLLLTHASDNGLGADRSQGMGTFNFVIKEATK